MQTEGTDRVTRSETWAETRAGTSKDLDRFNLNDLMQRDLFLANSIRDSGGYNPNAGYEVYHLKTY